MAVVRTGQAAPVGAFARKRAAQAGTTINPATNGFSPWVPPPIPPSFYNPIRDIEGAEGKRGAEQQQNALNRQVAATENNYGVNQALVGQREAGEQQDTQLQLGRIGEAFQRLQARQGEQGNATGTLYGGALLASGMKRAANQKLQTDAVQLQASRQAQADANERGRLALGEGEQVGPAGALSEALLNSRENDRAFQSSLGTLEGSEAAQAGYQAPSAPRLPALRLRPGVPPAKRGYVAQGRRKARI